MRIRTWSAALIALALAGSSCSENGIVAPTTAVPVGLTLSSVSAPSIVISQIYGGGGNSGATLKNDFIELFNPTGQPVDVSRWSVQYASAAGTSWAVTPLLSGTIPAGGYFLVKEAAGANGTVDLPPPNATGSIAMSGTDAKVAVVQNTTALTGACPTGFVDLVSYGSGNCVPPDAAAAQVLTNATADFRKDSGCAFTANPSADFTRAAPSPRNAASPVHVCPGTLPLGPLDHVVVAGPTTVTMGTPIQLTATPQDVNNQTVPTATVTWSSSDELIATVDQTGLVTGVAASPNTVGITATAVDNGIAPTSATVQITVAQAQINFIELSSSSSSFPAGFQTQLFATARVFSGGPIVQATFTFEAVDPQIATIATVQNTGIVTGVAAPADGTTKPGFRITAVPVGGGTPYSFVTHAITIEAPVSAPVSIYAKNDEFGDPTAADASNANDMLIVRPQYTISYNESRGTPNWVSYELDARQIVSGQDRCNCFTADQVLPSSKQIFTSDYTNGGYDRGHMARSFDRTAANVDNARTFYLTNIVPQTADLNQGVWASFENALGDSATKGGRAVYIITGPLYSRSHGLTYLKSEGKVAIPDSTWKVALIGPRNGGVPFTHGSIQDWNDVAGVTVLAVNMPNVAGVRNDLWQKYLTTVDKIETATGYDFLSLLPVAFQDALEAGDHAPVAQFGVSGTLSEGAPIGFDASASTDPDLGRGDLGRTEALSYAWQFSDGDQTSGKIVTKSFAKDGTYTATLVVSDAFGWEETTSRTVTIANVAPAISSFAGATLLRGETYTATGSFSDPGADQWTGTVNFGDGPATPSIDLTDKSFTLAHTYASAGSFSVVVSVNDGEVTSTRVATVVVKSTAQGIDDLDAALSALSLDNGEVNSPEAKLQAAAKQLANDNPTAAKNILGAFINEMQAMMQSGRVSQAAGSSIVAYAQRVIASITAP